MDKVSMIGIDLAKNSFQLHGAWADGSVAFRKKLSRGKVLADFSKYRTPISVNAGHQFHKILDSDFIKSRTVDCGPFGTAPVVSPRVSG